MESCFPSGILTKEQWDKMCRPTKSRGGKKKEHRMMTDLCSINLHEVTEKTQVLSEATPHQRAGLRLHEKHCF